MSDTYLGETFDSTTVDTTSHFDLVPNGKYMAQAIGGKVERTKAGDGSYLRLQFEIIEGPYEKRQVFQNITLRNASAKAAEIGRAQLGQLQEATGKRQISDAAELFGIPVMIKVGVDRGREGYDDQNKITGFAPVGSVQPPARQQQASPSGSHHQSGGNRDHGDYQPRGNAQQQAAGGPAGAWRNRR